LSGGIWALLLVEGSFAGVVVVPWVLVLGVGFGLLIDVLGVKGD
jgi:hypothetical protein